jgi:hypothetical protein
MPTSPFAASHLAGRKHNAANLVTLSRLHENGPAACGEWARRISVIAVETKR